MYKSFFFFNLRDCRNNSIADRDIDAEVQVTYSFSCEVHDTGIRNFLEAYVVRFRFVLALVSGSGSRSMHMKL
jgi:hypothetical protein